MKYLIRIVALAATVLCLAFAPLFVVSCKQAPSERVVQVQTLKAVGHTAETAVASAAQFYQAGKLTAEQANEVRNFYDTKFQPAFRLAVQAVNANLESVASPDLIALAGQLSSLVIQYTTPTK